MSAAQFVGTAETSGLEVSQRRLIGSIALLLGVSFLVVGLQSEQMSTVLTIVKRIFEASIAGAP